MLQVNAPFLTFHQLLRIWLSFMHFIWIFAFLHNFQLSLVLFGWDFLIGFDRFCWKKKYIPPPLLFPILSKFSWILSIVWNKFHSYAAVDVLPKTFCYSKTIGFLLSDIFLGVFLSPVLMWTNCFLDLLHGGQNLCFELSSYSFLNIIYCPNG